MSRRILAPTGINRQMTTGEVGPHSSLRDHQNEVLDLTHRQIQTPNPIRVMTRKHLIIR